MDVIGHLRRLYTLATIVVIGGSFVTHGGQNPLEPAAEGKAVLFGPHMENFREMAQQLLDAQAAVQAPDRAGVLAVCRRWLAQPQEREAVGARARVLVQAQSGATERTLDALDAALAGLLTSTGPSVKL